MPAPHELWLKVSFKGTTKVNLNDQSKLRTEPKKVTTTFRKGAPTAGEVFTGVKITVP